LEINPYATDYILYKKGWENTRITNIMIGGQFQKYFFIGKKPDDVIIKFEILVGKPNAPPLWIFGWQQCRFGWVTDERWEEVYNNYKLFDLPLDTMWADIDYMEDYKLFTIS